MSVGVFQAHPSGVGGMTIMKGSAPIAPAATVAEGPPREAGDGGGVQEVGGLLVTCGKTEGVVKIWDYTHVEDDGACGRFGHNNGSTCCSYSHHSLCVCHPQRCLARAPMFITHKHCHCPEGKQKNATTWCCCCFFWGNVEVSREGRLPLTKQDTQMRKKNIPGSKYHVQVIRLTGKTRNSGINHTEVSVERIHSQTRNPAWDSFTVSYRVSGTVSEYIICWLSCHRPSICYGRPSIFVGVGSGCLAAWWVLPAANYVISLEGSGPNGARFGWDQGAKWEQGANICVSVC